VKAGDNNSVIQLKNSSGVSIGNTVYYNDVWGNAPAELTGISQANSSNPKAKL
jgi:hypothetical protein